MIYDLYTSYREVRVVETWTWNLKGRAKLQCLKLWSGEVSVIWSTVQLKLTSEVLSSLYNISNVQSDDIYVYS